MSMAKGKKIVKWGAIILAALIYLSIAAIPFLNSVENSSKEGFLGILTVGEIIVLGVMAAILIAVVIVLIKKREKTASVVREYESEVKRITWLSWKDTKKSTVVVLIGLVVCATVISLLDLGLSEGFLSLITWIAGLFH